MATSPVLPRKRLTGAARWYTETSLAGPTRRTTSSTTVTAVATNVVQNSPDRVNLVITNDGAFDFLITPFANTSLNQGIRLGANGGTMTMTVRDDFEFVASEWWAISVGGSTTAFAIETIADQLLPPEQA